MAWGPSWGASSLASTMPTELRVVPFEKRFTTVLSAAALVSGMVVKVTPASTADPKAMSGRQHVLRVAQQPIRVESVNSLPAGDASVGGGLRSLMGFASAFTVSSLGRNIGAFGSPEAACGASS